MKSKIKFSAQVVIPLTIMGFLFVAAPAFTQIPPPGYERARDNEMQRQNLHPLDRDSVMFIDTALVFDPSNSKEELIIVKSSYSLRDYCIRYLGVQDPEMLLDGQPHTIVDPMTYEDLIIQYNPAGKIDTIPK